MASAVLRPASRRCGYDETKRRHSHANGNDLGGYNMRSAVDEGPHVVVAQEVSNVGSDGASSARRSRAGTLMSIATATTFRQEEAPWFMATTCLINNVPLVTAQRARA